MSNVFLPLGGSGGKNRGAVAVLGDDTPFTSKGSIVSLPLPAGNYKKSTTSPRSDYGDGKNSEVTISKELLKKMAIESFGIGSITNFSLSMYGHKQVQLTWKNPSVGLWSGARFVFKYGSLPESISDSFFIFDSDDVHFEKAMPEERELFVRVFNYVTVNGDRWYDNGDVSAKINVTGISGSVTLGVGAGVWTVPDKVEKIRFIVVGQGGAGRENGNTAYTSPAGGGGGYFVTGYMNVMPGQELPYLIPVFAKGLDTNASLYGDYSKGKHISGLDTIFTSITAEHGRSATNDYGINDEAYLIGGAGGSGGGGGNGGDGGRNGADGGQGGTYPYGWRRKPLYGVAGKGSHKSTTGFNGVRYCDGGAGGSMGQFARGVDGTDGLGAGGGGASSYGHEAVRKYMDGGKGGTGCIYIAWGSLMNDGT